MIQAAASAAVGPQTLLLPELGRPLFCHGATSLLDRPLVTLAGAHRAPPHSISFGRHLAERLAAAGFAVAAAADTHSGLGLLADASLWLSIFPTPEHVWAFGIDAADRVLGTLSTAVVVLDTGGAPDAFYVAEAAVRAGRRVFFPRAAAFRWPSHLGTAADVGASVGTILDSLTS